MEQIKIKINENTYCVEALAPRDALKYGPEVLNALGPSLGGLVSLGTEGASLADAFKSLFSGLEPDKVEVILDKAFKQCWTPQNQRLADAYTFDAWFMDHPEDMFELGVRAVWELARPFLPGQLATIASVFNQKAAAMSQSLSRQDGMEEPSLAA